MFRVGEKIVYMGKYSNILEYYKVYTISSISVNPSFSRITLEGIEYQQFPSYFFLSNNIVRNMKLKNINKKYNKTT